jgi:hypothetical protein
MPFMKAKERARRENSAKACKQRHDKARALKELRESAQPTLAPAGRRVVDLAKLATDLWCDACDRALSLRFLFEERQFGLASKLMIRCGECLGVKEVFTSSTAPDVSGDGRSLYSVNMKAALGKYKAT